MLLNVSSKQKAPNRKTFYVDEKIPFMSFFFFGRTTWLAGSQFPDQGLNPGHSSKSPEY